MPPSYLKKRKLGWYVYLPIPKAKQQAMGGRTALTESLRTRDEREAQRLRHEVIGRLQKQIAEAGEQSTPQVLLSRARSARAAIDEGRAEVIDLGDGLTVTDEEMALDAARDDFLAMQARRHGVDSEGHARIPETDVATLRTASSILTGHRKLSLEFQVEQYMQQIEASALTRQTVADKRRHLDSFLKWVGRETPAKSVTQRKAAAYFDEALLPREVSLQTKRVALGVVHQFFDWMLPRGVVTSNPFDRIGKLQLKESKRGRAPKWRVWTPTDLESLLEVIPKNDPLWPFTALVAYTGRRREDICSLRVEDASETFLNIQNAKSAAGVRRIPVHPVIQPLVRRLVETSDDGFLIPGLLTSGGDNKRGILLGKRFLYAMRKKAKLTDRRLVEHAFRHTVLTQLENAGVSLYLRGELVGHEHGTVTEKHYTLGVAEKRLSDAIAHVTYGKQVDTLVRAAGAEVCVAKVAKRRKKSPSG